VTNKRGRRKMQCNLVLVLNELMKQRSRCFIRSFIVCMKTERWLEIKQVFTWASKNKHSKVFFAAYARKDNLLQHPRTGLKEKFKVCKLLIKEAFKIQRATVKQHNFAAETSLCRTSLINEKNKNIADIGANTRL